MLQAVVGGVTGSGKRCSRQRLKVLQAAVRGVIGRGRRCYRQQEGVL